MPRIDWHPGMCIGIDEIDEQHEKLTRMFNELHDAYMDGQTRHVLSKIIIGMADYTNYHFRAEERRMRACAYPDIDQHMEQHDAFLKKTIDFLGTFADGQEEITTDVLVYLKNWLMQHILDTDRNLGSYLSETRIRPESIDADNSRDNTES